MWGLELEIWGCGEGFIRYRHLCTVPRLKTRFVHLWKMHILQIIPRSLQSAPCLPYIACLQQASSSLLNIIGAQRILYMRIQLGVVCRIHATVCHNLAARHHNRYLGQIHRSV
jgi:hypothetical protein